MAGSLRAFIYIGDDGLKYITRLDESTYEQSELGFADNNTSGGGLIPIIRGNPVKMRYINCYRDEGGVTVRRRFFVGNPNVNIFKVGGSIQLGGTQGAAAVEAGKPWLVSSSVGEKRRFIGFADTGRLDGDQDQPATTNLVESEP